MILLKIEISLYPGLVRISDSDISEIKITEIEFSKEDNLPLTIIRQRETQKEIKQI